MTGKEYNNQFSEEELKNEIWKDVPNFEGYYQVSNLGRIRNKKTNFILSPFLDVSKYFFINLYKEKKIKKFSVHRLVLLTFIGLSNGNFACHNDGIRTNNRLENLRWDTQLNNEKDKIKHGTLLAGENHPNARLSAFEVQEIRKAKRIGFTTKEISLVFNIKYHTILSITNKITWSSLLEEDVPVEKDRLESLEQIREHNRNKIFGIFYEKDRKKYVLHLSHRYIGRYNSYEEAVKAFFANRSLTCSHLE